MKKQNLIEYLEIIKIHYTSLAELMKLEGKERYYNEHIGKTKFIDLLLLNIRNDMFISNNLKGKTEIMTECLICFKMFDKRGIHSHQIKCKKEVRNKINKEKMKKVRVNIIPNKTIISKEKMKRLREHKKYADVGKDGIPFND